MTTTSTSPLPQPYSIGHRRNQCPQLQSWRRCIHAQTMAIELWEIEMFLRFCLLSSLGRAQEGGKKVGLSECLCRGSVKVAIEDSYHQNGLLLLYWITTIVVLHVANTSKLVLNPKFLVAQWHVCLGWLPALCTSCTVFDDVPGHQLLLHFSSDLPGTVWQWQVGAKLQSTMQPRFHWTGLYYCRWKWCDDGMGGKESNDVIFVHLGEGWRGGQF